jgi:prepilin-type N-terminal cleavage/methylation domain-containing protein/prepilin-type processing-associated H-X9-DG protein
MRNRNKNAFTLIEIMLVVVIILVLAGMLYPMYSKARESGRSTRCVANLRQLQIAALNYAQHDNWLGRGRMPGMGSKSIAERDPYTSQVMFYWHRAGWVSWYNYVDGYTQPNDITDGKYGWQISDNGRGSISNGTLWVYTKSLDVYLCPTIAKQYKNAVRSYSMFSISDYKSLLGDSGGTMVRLFSDDTSVMASPFDGIMGDSEIWRAHNNKGNVIYVDGHVEKL